MEYNNVMTVKKAASGLGFMLFAASTSMYVFSLIIGFTLYSKLDNTCLLLSNIIISIVCLFFVGLFYCWFSDTGINDVIKVKWVKLKYAFPLIIIALTVSFISDNLTDILQSSFGVFGVENHLDLSTESHTVVENILNIIAVAIIPALVEEFLFRGILLGKLRFFGDSFAVFTSTAMFALIHENIIQIPFAFIVGLALAFLTVKTNSLLPSIFVHFFVNFRSVLLSIIMDNKLMSEALLNNIYIIFLFIIFAAGIISAAVLSKNKGFFKLDSKADFPFKPTLKSSVLSVGMIFFIINSLTSTIFSVMI